MRNGDYTPSRMEAQKDAVNLIANAKTQQNPENSVAVLSMAGKTARVLVSLTQDLGKILTALHSVSIEGECDFLAGIQRAQLALKHRQNKNQRQRIIVFIGSPIKDDVQQLVKLGKKLKKNTVAIDAVNFGEETSNVEKLEEFINSVNNNDNSHLITVPPGPHILSDMLLSSSLIYGEAGAPNLNVPAAAAGGAAPGGAGGALDEFGGVDPNSDPELAMALRMSLEEELARSRPTGATGSASAAVPAATEPQPTVAVAVAVAAAAPEEVIMQDTDESDLFAEALQMSMASDAAAAANANTMDEDISETEQTKLAMQMSINESKPPTTTSSTSSNQSAYQDPAFLSSILQGLHGVDPNDERVKNALAGIQKKDEKKDEKKDDKDKKK